MRKRFGPTQGIGALGRNMGHDMEARVYGSGSKL